MIRTDLLPKRRTAPPTHGARAFLASCVVHGGALGLAVALALVWRSEIPVKSGSASGAVLLTLAPLVVVPAQVTPPPVPTKPLPPLSSPAAPKETELAPSPSSPVTPPPNPDGVPVLAVKPAPSPAAPPEPIVQTKSHPPSRPPVVHPLASKAENKPPAAATPSSYAAGANIFPHPPYPSPALALRQTGTVLINVQFDAQGGVVAAEIAKSSGVSSLDTATRSYIRANWHSPAYAGRTVSVPVQYTLEN